MKVSANRFQLVLVFFALSVIGCAQGGNDNDSSGGGNGGGDGGGSSNSFTVEATSDNNGSARATFSLPANATKFSVTAQTPANQQLIFTSLSDGRTNYLNPGGIDLGFFGEPFPSVISATAPSRRSDPDLDTSRQFTSSVEIDSSNTRVVFHIDSKADGDLNSGGLTVNVFNVGETAQDSDSKDVIDAAIEEMRRIYSSAGISVSIRQIDATGPVTLPDPTSGSSFYDSNTNSVSSPSINVFIGGDIGGTDGEVLGISAGIPGPAIPSRRSAVAVGLFSGAGPDGVYSNTEVRILGETIAHEVGHYMGLFHPVDFDGNSASGNDPLSDTPTCRTVGECTTNPDAVGNFMFFAPVANGDGDFVEQNQVTGEQRGVLNRNIAVS
jgi:hypothetical protein